jgi:hypothetical protein
MKRNLLISALLMLLIANLYSCKKDNSNSSGSSAVKLLTSSRWKFLKYEYSQNGTWIADPNAADEANFTAGFNVNNTFTLDDTDDAYTESGTWNFSSNNSILTTTGGGLEILAGVYAVTQLTSTTLQITNSNYPNYGPQRITFTH